MRGIQLLAFAAACVTAASCSSTANMGGTGGQNGGGNGGSGGIGQNGTGGEGNGIGGNAGSTDGGAMDVGPAGSGGKSGTGGQMGTGGEFAATGGKSGSGGQSGTGGQGDAGSTDCNPACGSGSVCVGSGTQGGAIFLADAGVCPPGRHVQGIFCTQDLTFACMPIPSGCNGTVTCACASSLCTPGGGRVCATPSPGELTCILEAP